MLVFDETKRFNCFKIRKHSTTVWVSRVTDQWEEQNHFKIKAYCI